MCGNLRLVKMCLKSAKVCSCIPPAECISMWPRDYGGGD